MARRPDVLVIGGGPVGACSALALAESGASVTLIEKEPEICPPVSGAFANCGLLVPSEVEPLAAPGALGQGLRWLLDGSSPFYVAPRLSPALVRWLWLFRTAASPARARAAGPVLRALNTASAGIHDELAARPAAPSPRLDGPAAGTAEGAGAHRTAATAATQGERWLFHHDGVVQAYETQVAMDEAVTHGRAAAELGVSSEVMTTDEVRARFPTVRGGIAGAVFFPDDGHLDPLLFTREVAAMSVAAGARVQRGAEALWLEPEGASAVRVVTTRGDFLADQVVLAAGAWTPGLTRRLGLDLPIEPAKGYSVDVARPPGFPELPLYLGDAHVVITPLGDALRLGSTLELSGWDMRVREKRVARLRQAAERVIGLPADGPIRQIWRGPRPVTPDGLPVIGRLPRRSRVIVATGHCMLGLSLGPVTGRLVAEVAGGKTPSIDLNALDPGRWS